MSVLLLPHLLSSHIVSFFFFNDTATTEIYTLSLHDALPISSSARARRRCRRPWRSSAKRCPSGSGESTRTTRSEEHTSELQSRLHLVCRLLLEKKKKHPVATTLFTGHQRYR